MPHLTIPDLALVLLVGPSGSGKSTFARAHFGPYETVSSDECRGVVSNDPNDQACTPDAFALLHHVVGVRLARGLLTVVDATNVQPEARRPLLALARQSHVFAVAIVLDLPERVCQARNHERPNRQFGPHVVHNQAAQLRKSLRGLQREGFRTVHVLRSEEEIAAATVERQPLWNNRTFDHGPFDIVGDVHGCADELDDLLRVLGYVPDEAVDADGVPAWRHPAGRKAVFLGDLVDRGPRTPDALRIAMGMVAAGTALAVPGNHDVKLVKALRGQQVRLTHGLAESVAQLDAETPEFRARVTEFLDGLVSHYVLDAGRLVVAHAGLKAELQGRSSGAVRAFALYGETTGESDAFGLPVRYPWANEYRGRAAVVYGHTPVPAAEWLNDTIDVDTGCVFGGRLTALRWPERALVSVPARRVYAEPARPFLPPATDTPNGVPDAAPATAQQAHDAVLDLADVTGKRVIATRLAHAVTVREENAAAALEVMSRFAADPRWLVYLPPTMSPSETSAREGYLEYPTEAFAYFRAQGVGAVVCEEKHMGSRAVVVVCRDAAAARRRFGVDTGETGIVYTRTGRRFFDDAALEAELLDVVRAACTRAGLWERLATDWVVLDGELMPWSAKARGLIREQYAAVSAAAHASLPEAAAVLRAAAARLTESGDGARVAALAERFAERAGLAERYTAAWERYCWPATSLADYRLAPFHLPASEGAAHATRDHAWHLAALGELCAADERGVLLATAHRHVDLADPAAEAEATAWWEALTGAGGEGMVVKPLDFVARGAPRAGRGGEPRSGPPPLVQPAVKCRGREYLRIIYGPEYTLPEHLARLRARGLGAKRGLALREFALGVEGLERFARGEPLRRVHECVFGVLALESEPVDPRL